MLYRTGDNYDNLEEYMYRLYLFMMGFITMNNKYPGEEKKIFQFQNSVISIPKC